MPVPSTINDLSTTAGANYPAGTESPSTIDDYLRAHASFLAGLRDSKVANTGNETIAGTKTFSSTIVGNISGNAGTATSATTATNLAGGSAGTLPYQTGSGATAQLAAGTSGYVLRANGAAAPSWTAQSAIDAGSVDGKSFGTFGDAGGILYATSTTDASATVAGTSGQVLLSGGASAPTWAAQSSLSVGSATTATSATSATSATTATNIAGGAAGAIPYQSGAGATALLSAGTSGQVFVSGGAGAPSWVAQSALTAGNVSGTVAIANGGTGQTTAAAAFGVLKQDATTSATGVVELATDAETQTGTDTARAITPSSLFSAFGRSLTTNGYQKFPGGLILQWGLYNNSDAYLSEGAITVNLPISFPTAALCGMATGRNSTQATTGGTAAEIVSISTTQITLFVQAHASGDTTNGIYWMALGY